MLVTIDAAMDLGSLAHLGRRLKGAGQTINLGADIFLADGANRYLGRIYRYRECHPRAACPALHCSRRHLNDDLQDVTLSSTLISAPPVELWPRIVARCAVPADTEALLVAELEKDGTPRDWPAADVQ